MGTKNPKRSEVPIAVRCAGCRRIIAWTDSEQAMRNKMFCNMWCMEEVPTTPTQERTDQWRLLKGSGMSPVAIAKRYDVAHSQVYVALRG